jgi:CHAD domain-containing protein
MAVQASLPVGAQRHLEPLHEFLKGHQVTEQRTLAKALRSARYRAIKRDWRRFLESGHAQGENGRSPNALRPVLSVARERIWKVYGRVLKDGAVLDANCPAEWFHDLRKTCKKLRYLLEFFQSLFPPTEISALIKSLKVIQDNLGVHNDLEVQALALTGFGQRMQAEGAAPADCLMAMGMLVEDLGRRQVQVRGEFAELFAPFSTGVSRKRFRKLFAPASRRKGKGTRR